MDAVRRDGNLTTPVDTKLTEHAQQPPNDLAFQDCSVVAECEMVRATDVSAFGMEHFEVGSSPSLFTCQAGVIKRVLLGFLSYPGIVQSLPATWIKDRDRRPL